jgi:membrane dipeptidase
VRASQTGVSLQLLALFTMPCDRNSALRSTLLLAEKLLEQMEEYSDYLYIVKCKEDILKNRNNNKIGCLMHLEGAECLGTDKDILSVLYRLGLRSAGLTWNYRNLLADGIGEESGGGLSGKGKMITRAMEDMGIILDLAHISEKGYYDALDEYQKPILVSHANARALCPHPRNLNDHQLKALAEHGGVIGLNQVANFVAEKDPTVDKFIDHITYVSELIGVEYIALGSDFDGAEHMVLNDVTGYKLLPEELAKRGFSEAEIQKILSENAFNTITAII